MVMRNPRDNETLSLSAIDLDPLLSCGLLAITSPESDNEKETFVNLTYTMKDGDAITGAIAITRNFTIATDDRRAIAQLRQRAPDLAVISTLDILKHWVDTANPPLHDVQQTINNIRIYASYMPGQNHPLYTWWWQHLKHPEISSNLQHTQSDH